jgi:hypothetical protein
VRGRQPAGASTVLYYVTFKLLTIFLSYGVLRYVIGYIVPNVSKAFLAFETYLLTPWSRVLLEKLTGSQLVKKFPTFYGNRRFITAFTSPRHLSLS